MTAEPAATPPKAVSQRVRAGRLVQLALTILACGAIVYIIDWEKFVGALGRAHFGMLALACTLFVATAC